MSATNSSINNLKQAKIGKTAESTQTKVSTAVQNAESAAFTQLDTAMSILNKLPKFTNVGMDLLTKNSTDFTVSPLGLLFKLLNKLGVTDEDIKKFLVNFIVYVIPELEIGIKSALLANIKSLVSCSLDPRIPKQMRKKCGEYYFDKAVCEFKSYTGTPTTEAERGMLIDCTSIDPNGMLSLNPYNEGKNYYFGILNNEDSLFETNTSLGSSTNGNTAQMSDKWKLCRAEDKNAFLWFAMHCAKFPSPYKAEIDGLTTTIRGIKYSDKSSYSFITLFDRLQLSVLGSESSKLSVGSTIVNSKIPNEISLCVNSEYDSDINADGTLNTGETRVYRNDFYPVSSDWDSVNWYVNPNDYYSVNLGLSNVSSSDYSSEKAICNLKYMKPSDYSTEDIKGSTQKFRFTILPKPYTYVPLGSDEPIWRLKRMLFNSKGVMDKSGRFSLPTDKMVTLSDGNTAPYVRDESYEIEREEINECFTNTEWTTQYKELIADFISGDETKVDSVLSALSAVQTKAVHIKLMVQTTDMNSYSAKRLDNKVQASYKKKVVAERTTTTDDYIKLIVGEKISETSTADTTCYLYINKKSGDYFLADSNKNRNHDFTQHLIECYNGITVYEFNYDYVMGMKLFDSKVICAKLFDTSTKQQYNSKITIGLSTLSDDTDYSSESLTSLIRKIIETDDTDVSDCYFSFSNDDYDSMLNESEKKRYNGQSYINGDQVSIDLSDAYAILDKYDAQTTKNGQQEVISDAITAAFATIDSSSSESYSSSDSNQIKLNFATNMLSKLASALIESILSPKVLMLIAVNKQLMGDGGEALDTKSLLSMVRGLVIGIIKELLELIEKRLLDFVIEFVTPLAIEEKLRLVKEQYQVYITILTQLLRLFKKGKTVSSDINRVLKGLISKYGKGSDWSNYDVPTVLDTVDYADIETTNEDNSDSPSTNNC